MRGISMSSVITSGTSSAIFSAATYGSPAVPITSISGSESSSAASVCRTTAESSTISTRIFESRISAVPARYSFLSRTSPLVVRKSMWIPCRPPRRCAITE